MRQSVRICAAVFLSLFWAFSASAETNPKKLPAVAAALHAARTVYLVEYPIFFGVDRNSFLAFYDALQATGRFQFVATRQQADVVFECTLAGLWTGYQVTVVDPHSLQAVGTFMNSKGIFPFASNRKKSIDALVKQARALSGPAAPGAATPVMLPAAPYSGPTDTKDAWGPLHLAKTVFLAPASNPKAPERLQAALEKWGGYRVVQAIDQADLVLALRHTDSSYCASTSRERNGSHVPGMRTQEVCDDFVADYKLQMLVLNPTSLNLITTGFLQTRNINSEDEDLSYDPLVQQLAAIRGLPY